MVFLFFPLFSLTDTDSFCVCACLVFFSCAEQSRKGNQKKTRIQERVAETQNTMSTRKLPVRSSTTSGLDSASSSGSEDSDSSSGSGNEGVVTRKPMARMANTGTDAAPTPVLSDHDYFDGLFLFFCFLCVVFFL